VCVRVNARLESVCTCTCIFDSPYSIMLVGVHFYKAPRTAAARACHPSAARLYSQHTGWDLTEWVCCTLTSSTYCEYLRAVSHADPCHR
jgi:hypothetical protein